MSKKVLYTAVVLTPESKARLLDAFPEPVLKKVHAHHMTIKFKPSEADVAGLELGAEVDLVVSGYAATDKIQAVAVVGFMSDNDIPHITVSTDGKTPPKESNALLAAGRKPLPTRTAMILRGTIEAVYPASRSMGKSTPELQAPEPPPSIDEASPDDLRDQGWWVACHNDYMIDRDRRTFWLLTKGNKCVQGRGPTDAIALNIIRTHLHLQRREA